jgi:trk system potassium uptake protein TrkA
MEKKKILIIGLGNFGSALAIKLTEMGHEVFGVDKDVSKVELYKDRITHTIAMDVTDIVAVQNLPYKEVDVAIVTIGEDFGASVLATAILKQLKVRYLIGRGISELHQTVLEAIEVDDIVMPEEEAAHNLALTLDLEGIHSSFQLSDEYAIIEAEVPEQFVGKTLGEINFRQRFHLNVITIRRREKAKNLFGSEVTRHRILGVVGPDTRLEPHDQLILFGKQKDIERFMERY